MTGTLQNTNEGRFFLTRYRPEFQPIFDLKKTWRQFSHAFVKWVNKC